MKHSHLFFLLLYTLIWTMWGCPRSSDQRTSSVTVGFDFNLNTYNMWKKVPLKAKVEKVTSPTRRTIIAPKIDGKWELIGVNNTDTFKCTAIDFFPLALIVLSHYRLTEINLYLKGKTKLNYTKVNIFGKIILPIPPPINPSIDRVKVTCGDDYCLADTNGIYMFDVEVSADNLYTIKYSNGTNGLDLTSIQIGAGQDTVQVDVYLSGIATKDTRSSRMRPKN